MPDRRRTGATQRICSGPDERPGADALDASRSLEPTLRGVVHNGCLGRVGRAAECIRLESGRRESVRGFKSLTLRCSEELRTGKAVVCGTQPVPPAQFEEEVP